mmetsp:Transcript_55696/g.156263  ORF Transcript_55696/g.156263 Transcript_55696/m.156263 type:complete len:361 (+) Transcript_55696:296-1378(+)
MQRRDALLRDADPIATYLRQAVPLQREDVVPAGAEGGGAARAERHRTRRLVAPSAVLLPEVGPAIAGGQRAVGRARREGRRVEVAADHDAQLIAGELLTREPVDPRYELFRLFALLLAAELVGELRGDHPQQGAGVRLLLRLRALRRGGAAAAGVRPGGAQALLLHRHGGLLARLALLRRLDAGKKRHAVEVDEDRAGAAGHGLPVHVDVLLAEALLRAIEHQRPGIQNLVLGEDCVAKPGRALPVPGEHLVKLVLAATALVLALISAEWAGETDIAQPCRPREQLGLIVRVLRRVGSNLPRFAVHLGLLQAHQVDIGPSDRIGYPLHVVFSIPPDATVHVVGQNADHPRAGAGRAGSRE